MSAAEEVDLHLLKPINDLLADPAITEIVINRPGEVGWEKDGRFTFLDVPELDFETLDAMGIVSGFLTNRNFDPAHPFCGSTLPGGQRIHMCRPPVTPSGVISMCIRKPPRKSRRVGDDDFEPMFSNANKGKSRVARVDKQLLDLYRAGDWKAFILAAIAARKTFGVAGVTGSGKTDMLRRLLAETPEDRRIVTIESDPEFGPIGPRNRVSLFYYEDRPGMTALDAVKASLRLYPKSIWFQEVRGAEAYALGRALISGHTGGGTSWHAERGQELNALAKMIGEHPDAKNQSPDQLREFARSCFDIIIYASREGGQFEASDIWFKDAENVQ